MKVTGTGEKVVGMEKVPLGDVWRLNQNDLEMLLKGRSGQRVGGITGDIQVSSGGRPWASPLVSSCVHCQNLDSFS